MTINVVCRKDAINRNHLAPLALVFTHDRHRKFVGLGMSVLLEHWDFEKQRPAENCPGDAEIKFPGLQRTSSRFRISFLVLKKTNSPVSV